MAKTEDSKKPWWQKIIEEEEGPVDIDAILTEDDPRNQEIRVKATVAMEQKMSAEEEEEERKQIEILEGIYHEKVKKPKSFIEPTKEEIEMGAEEMDVPDMEEEWEAFPVPDKEEWKEGDLDEEWADQPEDSNATAYDPYEWRKADDDALMGIDPKGRKSRRRRKASKKKVEVPPGVRTKELYVPFRKPLPPINPEGEGPIEVVEELEMQEEFMSWASYVFRDGASYEGTVFNDLAQGRGVYKTAMELCQYEGEWQQNMMQGHGVLTVDVPDKAPAPGSEQELRDGPHPANDFIRPEDRDWLRMSVEDAEKSAELVSKMRKEPVSAYARPMEEHPAWKKRFGMLPKKGEYKYSGQMKQSRMHGCGVYEVNGRPWWGKFYFGEFLQDPAECTLDACGFHAAMAEVTAAKARMFTNKPDGMVREIWGPYTDPSHPYNYDEDDMWMAPGFINEFHPVPKVWSGYVKEVDDEREAWLNSFTQAPFRVPMPPELEQLWDEDPEFVLLGNVPNREGVMTKEDEIMAHPALQGEVLVHTPSMQIINWASDKEGKLQFFIQPYKPGAPIDPTQAVLLPGGFEEFMNETVEGEEEVDEEAVQQASTAEERVALRKKKWEAEDARRAAIERAEEEVAEQRRKLAEVEEEVEQAVKEEEAWKKATLEEEARQLKVKVLEAKLKRVLGGEQEKAEEGERRRRKEEGKEKREVKQVKVVVVGGEKGAVEQEVLVVEVEAEEEEEVEEEEGEEEGGGEDGGGEEGEGGEEGVEEEEEEEEEEDEEEDEKGGKPRSFGKVAMADAEAMEEEAKRRGEEWRGGIPTAFASLSLASQGALNTALKNMVGRLAGIRLPWQNQAPKKYMDTSFGKRDMRLEEEVCNAPRSLKMGEFGTQRTVKVAISHTRRPRNKSVAEGEMWGKLEMGRELKGGYSLAILYKSGYRNRCLE